MTETSLFNLPLKFALTAILIGAFLTVLGMFLSAALDASYALVVPGAVITLVGTLVRWCSFAILLWIFGKTVETLKGEPNNGKICL